jgi:hypothetical protein
VGGFSTSVEKRRNLAVSFDRNGTVFVKTGGVKKMVANFEKPVSA